MCRARPDSTVKRRRPVTSLSRSARRLTVKQMRAAWPALIVLFAVATSRGETFTAGIDDLRDPAFWKTVAESLDREPADVAIKDGDYAAVPGVIIAGVGHERNALTIRPASAGKVSFADSP